MGSSGEKMVYTIIIACGWLTLVASAMAASGQAAESAVTHMTMKHGSALAIGVTLDTKGQLWLARMDKQTLWVSHSADFAQHFSTPVAVNAEPEAIAAENENRPKILVGRDGTIHLTWTRLLPRPYTGEIRYARSTDGGHSFSLPITVNDDKRLTSHRFDSLSSDGRGKLAIVWLDGRERDAAKEKGEAFDGVSIYTARSDDNGVTFQSNKKISDHTCECCRTALTWSTTGPVALWRNLYGTNTRDFAMSALDTGKLQRVADDEWNIDACPHHGGSIATGAGNALHVVWYTSGKNRQGLFYRRLQGSESTPPMAFGNPQAQAGHATLAAEGKTVLLAWREFDGNAYGAWTMLSSDGGTSWGQPHRIASTDDAADYPIPLLYKQQARVVWNTMHDGLRVLGVE